MRTVVCLVAIVAAASGLSGVEGAGAKDAAIAQLQLLVTLQDKQIQQLQARIAALEAELAEARAGAKAGPASKPSASKPSADGGVSAAAAPKLTEAQQADLALRRKLGTTQVRGVSFERTPLSEVLSKLGTDYDVPIVVDWKALEAVGVKPTRPVTIRLVNIRLNAAMTYILRGTTGLGVSYEVLDGAVTFSTELELNKRNTTREMPVSDIIEKMQAETPRLSRPQVVKLLIRSVTNKVSPGTWRAGSNGIWERDGKLVVVQRREVNQSVSRHLGDLRAQMRRRR
jgi:hypothetical protein